MRATEVSDILPERTIGRICGQETYSSFFLALRKGALKSLHVCES